MFFCARLLAVVVPLLAVVNPQIVRSDGAGANDADAIAAVREEWVSDLHAKKLDPIVMLYTPDAVFLPPNHKRVSGRAAIRELTRQAMQTFTSDIVMTSLASERSGDLAYDSGEFKETLTLTAGGKNIESHGSYLTVLKRQPDGKWLIAQQAWTETGGSGDGMSH